MRVGPDLDTLLRNAAAANERLAQLEANTEWQRDLSVSDNQIGDVLKAQGDGPGRSPRAIRPTRNGRRMWRFRAPGSARSNTDRTSTPVATTCNGGATSS